MKSNYTPSLSRQFFKLLLGLCIGGTIAGFAAEPSLVSLVNPLQGTDSKPSFSHGNEYPAICLPFPMNTWAPYTQPEHDSFYYQYRQTKIRGIRQTHQPSPWIADYATFALMPVSGKLAVTEEERASEFRHEAEVVQPSYYRVRLDTWKTSAEVTPTDRCARFRFTFEEAGDAYVVLDAFPGGSSVEIIPSENKIVGITRYNHGGVPDNFSNYFVIVFDQPFQAQGVWTPEGVQAGVTHLAGKHTGTYVKFKAKKGTMIGCKVASSFISPEQALRNMQQEIGKADFDTIRSRAEKTWNEALGRARVEGGSEDQRRTFYSALYRSIVYPHRFYEYGADGKPTYFSPYDGKIHSGVLYTDTGFWDTFRAAHPLYNLLYPEISAEILQGLMNAYDQSGWLPSWSSPGHRACMIGNHAFSLLADGWVKGIRSFDADKAVAAISHDANTQGPDFCRAIGRDGVEFYNRLGYVPYSYVRGEPSVGEATAKTLEYAYDDFCAATLAQAAGRTADVETFARKAMSYTNLFDAKIGFMRGRKADGSWNEPFDPTEWGGPFTEGCSWHWTWSVFQDVPGLVRLMGGESAFAAKLDEVFTAPNTFKPGTYGGPIHEMTEMAALDLGQYAHGNEPIHHMIYLYDYAGQPWKAQSRARLIMNKLYQAAPDGLCGDEDTGQTSAWYVFSALGFYPVCPGTTDYLIGSSLFDRATLTLPKGKTFTITARNNGPQHAYIHGASLDGKPFNKVFLTHDEITRGGEIVFEMDSAPNTNWASGPESRPSSAMSHLGRSTRNAATSGLRKLMDTPLRDTSICQGPDGTWYLTGTVAPFWSYNEGIKLWKSMDLVNWQPLGFVWKYGDSPWHKKYLEAKKPLWAPEIHYLKGTFWLTYSIPGWDGTGKTSGCGLLRSTTGKPEGPYADVQPNERLGDEIDASLFEDDDGSVYYLWHSGKIARMKPDMSGLAEPYHWLKTATVDADPKHHSGLCAGIFGKDSFNHVGFEGAFIFKRNGRYYLSCADEFERRYSCMMASSTNIYGPYSERYEAIPHGGHNVFFKDSENQWWSAFFGSDSTAPWREQPGILPVRFDQNGRLWPQ
jgi:predicted alpha-1,2-mannosidase